MKGIAWVLLLLFLLAGCAAGGETAPTHSPEGSETPSSAPAASQTVPSDGLETDVTQPPETAPEELPGPDEPEEVEVILFLPNENADGFVEVCERVEVTPQSVIDALIARGALPEGTKVLEFRQEGGHLVLDLSREFEAALCSMGTSGEAMLTGSLANTMLTCWGADTLLFTCEGEIVESGHVIYDFPLTARE